MKKLLITTLAAGALALTSHVQGQIIFSDDFNSENGGNPQLNYFGFANWTINPGSVDLIGLNSGFDFYPGNGLYVDLDGSTGFAGTMTSTALALAPGNYTLSFLLGGSTRGDVNKVDVSIDGNLASYVENSGDPLALETMSFTVGAATSANIVIHNYGGDNLGAILDNVVLTKNRVQTDAPDSASTAMLLSGGMFGLAALRRKLNR